MEKKSFILNISSNVLSFVVNLFIHFFLTRYIIQTIGEAAYGFVGLGNNFINYAMIVTSALNSMASRFVSLHILKGDHENAQRYMSSVVVANLVLSLFLVIPAALIVLFLDRLVRIDAHLLWDVRLLWSFLFAGFFLTLCLNVFSVATFAKNKIYLNSLRNIEAQLIRAVLFLVLFSCFTPRVWYIGLVGLVCSAYICWINILYTRRFLPDLQIRRKYFAFGAVKELIVSGMWNSVSALNQQLLEGMDLLIANLFISDVAMGILAVTKIVSTYLATFISTFVTALHPTILRLHAEEKRDQLIAYVKKCNNFMGLIIGYPLAILVVFGKEFYGLWLPHCDAGLYQALSVLGVLPTFVSGTITVLFYVFTATNRIRANSLFTLATGLLNVGIVFLLLQTTHLGIFAVAGVSSVLGVVRNLTFTPIYAAKCLSVKWNTFYGQIAKSWVAISVLCLIGYGVKWLIPAVSWWTLAAGAGLTSVFGLAVNLHIMLNHSDRNSLWDSLSKRISKKA